MSLRVRISGVQEAVAKLKQYDVRKQQGVRRVVAESAFNIEKTAKKRAPVDTGRLRSSITSDFKNSGFSAETKAATFYAIYVEFGTSPHFPPVAALRGWAKRHRASEWAVARGIARRGTPAQPFLYPAFLQEKPRFIRNLRAEMSKL